MREAIFIAHEFGHYRSLCAFAETDNSVLWSARARAHLQALIDAQNKDAYDPLAEALVLDEEATAWSHAEELLSTIDASHSWRAGFDAERHRALDSYRAMFVALAAR